MKDYQPILHAIGYRKGRGIYEESDGNHRCVSCNKKLRDGQVVISVTSPNSHGYRRDDTFFYHEVCPRKAEEK